MEYNLCVIFDTKYYNKIYTELKNIVNGDRKKKQFITFKVKKDNFINSFSEIYKKLKDILPYFYFCGGDTSLELFYYYLDTINLTRSPGSRIRENNYYKLYESNKNNYDQVFIHIGQFMDEISTRFSRNDINDLSNKTELYDFIMYLILYYVNSKTQFYLKLINKLIASLKVFKKFDFNKLKNSRDTLLKKLDSLTTTDLPPITNEQYTQKNKEFKEKNIKFTQSLISKIDYFFSNNDIDDKYSNGEEFLMYLSRIPVEFRKGTNKNNIFKETNRYLKYQSNIDYQNQSGWTPLMVACSYNVEYTELGTIYEEIVKKILIKNPNSNLQITNEPPRARDENTTIGNTALMLSNNANIVNMLVDFSNTNVNIQNQYGWTALHFAVKERNLGKFNILLSQKNIDPFLETTTGKTPLQLLNTPSKNNRTSSLISAYSSIFFTENPELKKIITEDIAESLRKSPQPDTNVVEQMRSKLEEIQNTNRKKIDSKISQIRSKLEEETKNLKTKISDILSGLTESDDEEITDSVRDSITKELRKYLQTKLDSEELKKESVISRFFISTTIVCCAIITGGTSIREPNFSYLKDSLDSLPGVEYAKNSISETIADVYNKMKEKTMKKIEPYANKIYTNIPSIVKSLCTEFIRELKVAYLGETKFTKNDCFILFNVESIMRDIEYRLKILSKQTKNTAEEVETQINKLLDDLIERLGDLETMSSPILENIDEVPSGGLEFGSNQRSRPGLRNLRNLRKLRSRRTSNVAKKKTKYTKRSRHNPRLRLRRSLKKKI